MKKQPPPDFPSEWKRPSENPLPLQVLEGRGFNIGRMVSASKSDYSDRYPSHFTIFNANIVTLKGGKIWYGDLDLTAEAMKLKDAASEAGQTLYVLRERDARFGAEDKNPKLLVAKAVWDTTQGIPVYDEGFKVVFRPGGK